MSEHKRFSISPQAQQDRSALLEDACYEFLKPLLRDLHRRLDRRLVATFLHTVLALLRHRTRAHGLVLTELGAWLAGPAQAMAGTKRLKRLLYAPAWWASLITDFLWRGAQERVQALLTQGETPLVLWDESVIEKSESLHLEGLGPVRSVKAARLKRIKPGYFNPPGGPPVFVPGWHWLAVLVVGGKGGPTLATLRFWTTRGERARSQREEEAQVLWQAAHQWGHQVIHVWDRGFAGLPWLQLVLPPGCALHRPLAERLWRGRRSRRTTPGLADRSRETVLGGPSLVGCSPTRLADSGDRRPSRAGSIRETHPLAHRLPSGTWPSALVSPHQ